MSSHFGLSHCVKPLDIRCGELMCLACTIAIVSLKVVKEICVILGDSDLEYAGGENSMMTRLKCIDVYCNL